jgi:hypothetical protein
LRTVPFSPFRTFNFKYIHIWFNFVFVKFYIPAHCCLAYGLLAG